jgi:apolipoprotein N-acyltransferase
MSIAARRQPAHRALTGVAALGQEAGVGRASSGVPPRPCGASPRAAPILALVAGVTLPLTIPPFDLHALMWLAAVPLMHAARCASGRFAAAGCGAIAGLALAVAVDYGLLPFSVPLLAMTVGVVVAVLAGVTLTWRLLLERPLSPALRVAALAAAWVAGEWLSIAVRVPWSAALTQAEHPVVVQGAAVLGMLAVSSVVLLVDAAVFEASVWLLERHVPAGAGWAVVTAGVPLLMTLAYGARCLARPPAGGAPLRVAAIQPVIASAVYHFHGFNPEYRRLLLDVVDGLSREAATTRPDLLVWSEGGNGQFNLRVPARRRALAALASGGPGGLLVATYDLDEEGRLFNSVVSLDREAHILGRYDKVELTPIGEAPFTAGTRFETLPTPHGRVGAMVCFESCFPRAARALARGGAGLLVVTTSDAAFRVSSLPALHGLFAVYRAVETRRPLVQAANTGPSFVVDAYGRRTAALPPFVRGVLHGTVVPRTDVTPYTRLGDAPLLAALVVVLAAALVPGRAERRSHRSTARAPGTAGVWLMTSCVTAGAGVALALGSSRLVAGAVDAPPRGWREAAIALTAPPAAAVSPTAARRFLQSQPNTCGLAALAYLLTYLGDETTEAELLSHVTPARDGVTMLELAALARTRGFVAFGERRTLAALRAAPKPLIAHVRDDHYVVVLAQRDGVVDVFDPARGYARLTEDAFAAAWHGLLLAIRFAPLANTP